MRSTAFKIILAYFAMTAIIWIRGDSYFPLPKTTSTPGVMFFVLAHTLVFIAAYVLWTRNYQKQNLQDAETNKRLLARGVVGMTWMYFFLSVAFHFIQAKRFPQFGYQWTYPLWIVFGLISAVLLFQGSKKLLADTPRFASAAVFIFLSVLALRIPPILDFPLNVGRSDMLLNIEIAGKDILQGISPYRYHSIQGLSTPNIRLPGMLWAYLPFTALSIDLRWGKLLFELICGALLLYRINRLQSPAKLIALACFLIFWSNPYLAFRHDTYEAPFWMIILLVLMTLETNSPILNGVLVGILFCTHQWGWVAFPFLFWHRTRTLSLQGFFKWLLPFVLVTTCLLGPYVVFDYKNFMAQLFGNYGMHENLSWDAPNKAVTGWERIKDAHPYSMSFRLWVSMTDIGYSYLMYIMAACLAVCWTLTAISSRSNSSHLLWGISLAWLITLWLSPVGWTYQYCTIVFAVLCIQLAYFTQQTKKV
jgi:hypothetical protein